MKRAILIICSFMIFLNFNKVHASFIPVDSTVHTETWKNLKVSEFVKLSTGKFEAITGKKLSLGEKISFSFTKMRMKKSLKKNPDLTVEEYLSTSRKLGTGWIIVISAIGGILLFMLIILIAYS